MRSLTVLFCLLLLPAVALTTHADAEPGSRFKAQKILVYGASGKVGSKVVAEALQRGHFVTAVSRDPARITVKHENLSVVKGNVLDPQSVTQLLRGQDAVVVSVRGVLGKSKRTEDAVPYRAVETIVGVLRENVDSTTRLLHVGGSGSLKLENGDNWADRLPMWLIPRKLEVEIKAQVLILEYLRKLDDVAWTYITPAKNFTNGERTGQFRTGGDLLFEDARGRSRISRSDFAVALLDEVENTRFIRQRFSVAY